MNDIMPEPGRLFSKSQIFFFDDINETKYTYGELTSIREKKKKILKTSAKKQQHNKPCLQ